MRVQFEFSIDTENAAFQEDPAGEVAAHLESAAKMLREGRLDKAVFDVNGNRVGEWFLSLMGEGSEDEDEEEDDAAQGSFR